MISREFTDQEKLRCLEREIEMRRKVYPNRIRQGLMSPSHAEHEIACMEAIAAEYRARIQGDMFA
jgi:hypothetical protein